MNSQQEDKLTMYYTVKSTNERFQPTWITNAVYAATYNLWAAKFALIEQNRDAQTIETTGVTTDKKNKRALMSEKAAFIQNRIQSYANVVNNVELLESVNYSTTKMAMARDTDIVGICNTILSRASANAVALVPYGVTAAIITELQAAITAYSAMVAKPKTVKSQTKTATENLTKLFKEADELLTKRLDLDIELFKTSKPDFYSQYKTARIITPTGGGATSVVGNVTVAGSGEPVKGAIFTFVAENNGTQKTAAAKTAKPIVKKSAEKGKFRAVLPENTYRVGVEKIGFKKQEVIVTVANGATTNLNIVLERNL